MPNRFQNQQHHNQDDWDDRRQKKNNDPYQQSNYGNNYNQGYDNQNEGRSYNDSMNRPYGNSSYSNQDNYGGNNYDIYGSRSHQQYGNNSYGQGYGTSYRQEYGGNSGRNDNYGSYDPGFSGRGYDQYRDVDYNQWNKERRFTNHPFSSGRSNYDQGGYNDARYDGDRHRSNNRRDWWDRTSDEIASWFGDEDAERRRRVDKVSGPHKGKGPKDYHRSDDRIRDDINDRLYDDSFVDASDIEVKVENGEVTLSGTVDSKEIKRRAEDIAESVTGVSNVSNNLKVSKPVTAVGSTNLYSDRNDRNDKNDRYDRDRRDRW